MDPKKQNPATVFGVFTRDFVTVVKTNESRGWTGDSYMDRVGSTLVLTNSQRPNK